MRERSVEKFINFYIFSNSKMRIYLIVGISLILLLFLTGCNKDDENPIINLKDYSDTSYLTENMTTNITTNVTGGNESDRYNTTSEDQIDI